RNASFLNRFNEAVFTATGLRKAIDTLAHGWYFSSRNWFDDWASVSQIFSMQEEIIEFTVAGSPRNISSAIESYATGHGSLHAIVVPWESDNVTLSMAVTSVSVDGWAIAHTDLGTIRLTGVGNDQTRVSFAPREPNHADKKRLSELFEGFARKV